MLLPHPPSRNDAAGGQSYRRPKNGFRHEDAFSVMAKSAMPEVRSEFLGLIEPWSTVCKRCWLWFGAGPLRAHIMKGQASHDSSSQTLPLPGRRLYRSEERRVGKECRSR